jgi:hypothetical protein
MRTWHTRSGSSAVMIGVWELMVSLWYPAGSSKVRTNAVHASFTDLALLADQTGIEIDAGLSGARSLDITRAYVRAFFDQHLRGRPQSLLDQPSRRYPEVIFCSPEAEARA